jgi:hypothetical protein
LAGVLFLLVCAACFAVLRAESLPHEWIFLFGLLPAFPFAAYTARRLARPSGRLATALYPLATFAIYFWLCGAALWVRSLWTT